MDTTSQPSRPAPPLRLRAAVARWAACLAVFIAGVTLARYLMSDALGPALLLYAALGVYLNRAVLRRIVEWHPTYNTLDNVAGQKLRMVAFWPVAYAVLFFKVGVDKVL